MNLLAKVHTPAKNKKANDRIQTIWLLARDYLCAQPAKLLLLAGSTSRNWQLKFFLCFLIFTYHIIALQAEEAFYEYKIYNKFGFDVTSVEKEISTAYYSDTFRSSLAAVSFDIYLQYSLFYRNFYFAISPEYQLKDNEHYLQLKGMELQFFAEKLTLSLGKVAEQRTLVQSRDYLLVPNRLISFNDDFRFWRLSIMFPTDYISLELGTRYIRENYQYEWENLQTGMLKHFVYADFDYKGLSIHGGASFWQKLNTKNMGNDYTFKISYSFDNILSLYTAHLVEQDFYHRLTLNDYSHTLGADFSLATALAEDTEVFDLRPSIELILEKENYSIVSTLSLSYKNFASDFSYGYQFSSKDIHAKARISYRTGPIEFAVSDTIIYQQAENRFLANTFAIEVIYELY